jgi:hypothetical protein
VKPNFGVGDPNQLRATLGGLMRGITGPENPPLGVLPDGSLLRDMTYLAKAPSRIFPQGERNVTQDGNRGVVPQQQASSYDSTSGTASGTTVTLTRTQYGDDPNVGGTMRTENRTGTHAFRDNNPGNIEYGDFAKANGAVGQDGRFAIFPTSEAGFRALSTLLTGQSYRTLTLDAAIARYAPPSENDTAAYQAAVRAAVGVSGDTRLSSLTADQLQRMTQAIARIEGFTQQGTVRTGTRLIPNYP